jgi:mono/diheme cytochrome c family protein
LLFVGMLLGGCGSQPAPAPKAEQTPAADPAAPAPPEVSFAKDIQSIVAGNCLPCHSGARDAQAPFNWTTYEGVIAHVVPGQPEASKFYLMLKRGAMPPDGRLDSAKIGLVSRWISEDDLRRPGRLESPCSDGLRTRVRRR